MILQRFTVMFYFFCFRNNGLLFQEFSRRSFFCLQAKVFPFFVRTFPTHKSVSSKLEKLEHLWSRISIFCFRRKNLLHFISLWFIGQNGRRKRGLGLRRKMFTTFRIYGIKSHLSFDIYFQKLRSFLVKEKLSLNYNLLHFN